MQKGSYTDVKKLVLAVAGDDQRAFERLYELYKDEIRQYVILFDADVFFTDDTVQDIFVKLWQKREILRKVENFPGWLFFFARNFVLDQKRKKQREQINREDYLACHQQFWPPQENEIPDSHFVLQQSIRQLPLRQRQALVLIKGMGCTRRETAELLGLSENAVKFNMKMALRSARKLTLLF